jgi:hypothetical protein
MEGASTVPIYVIRVVHKTFPSVRRLKLWEIKPQLLHEGLRIGAKIVLKVLLESPMDFHFVCRLGIVDPFHQIVEERLLLGAQ